MKDVLCDTEESFIKNHKPYTLIEAYLLLRLTNIAYVRKLEQLHRRLPSKTQSTNSIRKYLSGNNLIASAVIKTCLN